MLNPVLVTLSLTISAIGPAPPAAANSHADVPRYAHIFVIIEENHTYSEIMGKSIAPSFNAFAKQYGVATNFYGERHPSEPNYIAILGGDTFGIADDDGYYCKAGDTNKPGCEKSDSTAYADHTLSAKSLMDQLETHGLSWKGYFEDIPAAGSDAHHWPTAPDVTAHKPIGLYVVKHNGFMNFKRVQDDPKRGDKIVGFDVLMSDIESGNLPNFAEIIPNQCNDMHGLHGPLVPDDCDKKNDAAMIARADAEVGKIVGAITQSAQWAAPDNAAIVITWDENDTGDSGGHPSGCCAANSVGGGWIPTLVITNHGPRGITDPAPYNHYSLLRTTEDAFGIAEHLGHAADSDARDMTPLFAVRNN